MTVNAPEIRFKGFTDAWTQRKFSDVICKLTGGASIEPDDYQDNGIRTIPKGAVNATGIADLSGSKFIDEAFFEKNKSSKVSTNDIVTSLRDLVPSAPNMGRIVRIEGDKEDFLMPQGVYRIELYDGVDEHFVITYSNSDRYRKIITAEKNGSTQVHIRNGEFLNIDIPICCSKEQTAIGSFFRALDDIIATNQHKHDRLKKLKAAYLQQMFPQAGESVPRVRFAGFAKDWTETRLGDIADIVRGASPRPIQDPKWFDENSDVGWLRISDVTEQDGRIHYLEQKISKAGQSKTRVLIEPHLLLSIAATVGKPVINYIKTGVHDGFLIFLNPQFEQEFMFQWLEMFRLNWQQYGQPGSQVNLNSDLVKNQELCIPSRDEQTAIGGFFSNLDTQITAQAQKLEQLKQLKEAYSQKMFV